MKFPAKTTKKIAVFRALQLGDMLCSVPALRALRHNYPDAEITLLGLPWATSFRERFARYVDRFMHFPGFPGLPEQDFSPLLWEQFEAKMRSESFDLLLQMQGNGNIVNDMLENLKAGTVAGFHSAGNYRNGDLFLEYPTGISEIHRHLLLLEFLGIPARGAHLEFPVFDSEKRNLHESFPMLQAEQYVCVHPGSRGAWRQWPPGHFAALADVCAQRGYQVVVTGTRDEAEITADVIELMKFPALDLTGKTGLGEIGELISKSRLLISNCTGVSHIASAVRTPSIVISMDGEPERWGPLDESRHKTIDWLKNPGFDFVLSALELLLNDDNLLLPQVIVDATHSGS